MQIEAICADIDIYKIFSVSDYPFRLPKLQITIVDEYNLKGRSPSYRP